MSTMHRYNYILNHSIQSNNYRFLPIYDFSNKTLFLMSYEYYINPNIFWDDYGLNWNKSSSYGKVNLIDIEKIIFIINYKEYSGRLAFNLSDYCYVGSSWSLYDLNQNSFSALHKAIDNIFYHIFVKNSSKQLHCYLYKQLKDKKNFIHLIDRYDNFDKTVYYPLFNFKSKKIKEYNFSFCVAVV